MAQAPLGKWTMLMFSADPGISQEGRISQEATMSLLQKTDDLPISRLRQLDTEKVVLLPRDLPVSRLRQSYAEKFVLLPLLGSVIAGIIYLVGALNR
jgi:hypothetical protein